MNRRPGRHGRRATPRGPHRATPLWLPAQPPATDVRLLGTPSPGVRSEANEAQSLFGPPMRLNGHAETEAALTWVQLSTKGFSVN